MKVSAAIPLHASGTQCLGCCIPFRLPCHPIAGSQQHQSCCISSRGYSESKTGRFSNIPWFACVALKTWGGFERRSMPLAIRATFNQCHFQSVPLAIRATFKQGHLQSMPLSISATFNQGHLQSGPLANRATEGIDLLV